MRTVRISLRTARDILNFFHEDNTPPPYLAAGIEALRAATKPNRSVVASRKRKDSKRKTKREETAEIRAAVMQRSRFSCEHCGYGVGLVSMDHFFGRVGVKQSVRNCWALCWPCHREKTRNEPSAAEWLGRFISHCHKYGYDAEANRARARLQGIVAMRAKEASHGP